MSPDQLIGLVGSLGFPIIAYLLLYFRLEKVIQSNTDIVRELLVELKSRGP